MDRPQRGRDAQESPGGGFRAWKGPIPRIGPVHVKIYRLGDLDTRLRGHEGPAWPAGPIRAGAEGAGLEVRLSGAWPSGVPMAPNGGQRAAAGTVADLAVPPGRDVL